MPGKESFQEQQPVEINVDEFLEAPHDPIVRPAHPWRAFLAKVFEQVGRQEHDGTYLHPL
jgi:hypothetical protein